MSANTNGSYLKYEYEETTKIIAPYYTPIGMATGLTVDPCGVKLVTKYEEEETCYRTDVSSSIILASTYNLEQDHVKDFEVRFLNRNNYIISHRYSILVKQLVIPVEAFSFYETLANFSKSESYFSGTQPGFFSGNIYAKQNKNEKVLGFFNIATQTEKRLFFNYTDFYPNEPLPPYADECNPYPTPLRKDNGKCYLAVLVDYNFVRYVGDNHNPVDSQGPYFVVPRICGDCTVLGGITPPPFWTEE